MSQPLKMLQPPCRTASLLLHYLIGMLPQLTDAEITINSLKHKKLMTTDSIISKVWSFCTTLRDDGVSYGDHLAQCLVIEQNEKEYDHSLRQSILKIAFSGKLIEQTQIKKDD